MYGEKNPTDRRAELRDFLMTRRAAISPETVGLPAGLRRRTPGLRREELAVLAGIGVTWYTWFEQGREIRVSAPALERIAAALRLSPTDTEYLFSLCGVLRAPRPTPEELSEHAHAVLVAIQAAPAFFCNPRGDVLAYNPLADYLFDFEGCDGPFANNHHWRFFMDPKRRARYLEWERLAEMYVPWLRLAHGKAQGDLRFERLIQELYAGSEVFRHHWDLHTTAPLFDAVSIGMALPPFERLQFNSVRFVSVNSRPGLAILTPADDLTRLALSQLSGELKS